MSHVLIAWGGSMFFVLLVFLTVSVFRKWKCREKSNDLLPAALTVFLPFLLTCFITLTMLYQVDGNYYMTAYSLLILLVCPALPEKKEDAEVFLHPVIRGFLLAMSLFQFTVMTMTSWAGNAGFFPIGLNRGYFDHQAYYREQLKETDGKLYSILSADAQTRAVAFGEHPLCLQFPCIVQSYNDITSPWGNVELVNSPEAFLEYLHFAGIDYVYADASHLAKEEWSWSRGLLEELAANGDLTDFVYEGENWIARVN